MASEYSVNIKLNTAQVNRDLKKIGDGIANLGKKQGSGSKSALSATDKKLNLDQKILTFQNRILTVGNSRLKTITKENKLSQTKSLLTRANNQALQGEFDLSKKNILKAIQQIKLLQKETLIKKGIQTQTTKKVKTEDTINKQLRERVKTLGQIVKLRNLGTAAGRLAGRFEFEEALQTRGPGGRMLALPSAEMLDQRVRGSGQVGGFSRRIPRFRLPKPTRGFDVGSALISGGFPLLFGQGPGVAAAGALGGGIGGMFGQMGGFAGGIAATAAVQTIQSAVQAIGDLGKALGPFTKNSQAAIEALGLQGSAQEARIKLIERAQGKNAAFNATMELMANRVGDEGVESITKFGETTRMLNNQFATGVARVQAFTASILNFLIKITGYEDSLRDADVAQTLSDARMLDDPRALALEAEKQTILKDAYRTVGHGGSRKVLKTGAKDALEDLEAREKILATIINTEIEAATLTEKFDEAAKKVGEERDMTERILELRREGLNPEIAKTIAELEKQAKTGKDALQAEIDKLLEKQQKLGELDPLDQARLTTLEKQRDKQDEIIDGIRETEEATHDLNKAAEETLDAFDKLKTTIQSDIKDGIKGLIKGTSTLADLASNVADRFLDIALNQALYGNAGGQTVTGGLFKFLGFANGGRPPVGRPSVVGEKGPELFVPDRSGTIIPNHAMGGSTNIVVNVDASGSSVEGDEQGGRELGRLISVAIQSELVQQKRPGGLLA